MSCVCMHKIVITNFNDHYQILIPKLIITTSYWYLYMYIHVMVHVDACQFSSNDVKIGALLDITCTQDYVRLVQDPKKENKCRKTMAWCQANFSKF